MKLLYWILSVVTIAVVSVAINYVEVEDVTSCSILIAGGSLSSLAAALTAVNVTLNSNKPKTRVCLIEPTNWAGGQLTSSNVPPDFGSANSVPDNLPQSFVDVLLDITNRMLADKNQQTNDIWKANPGMCWVSYKCFEAPYAVDAIISRLSAVSDVLSVYYNTVISSTVTDITAEGNYTVKSVTAIQRSLRQPQQTDADGYDNNLSEDLSDWYSSTPSNLFTKRVLKFSNFTVLIESTEFGDVLSNIDANIFQSFNQLSDISDYISSGSSISIQGAETPTEMDSNTISNCGQETVFPFYMYYGDINNASSHKRYLDASYVDNKLAQSLQNRAKDVTNTYSLRGLTWEQVWSYRRSSAASLSSSNDYTVDKGETSNQNLDNDEPVAYLFISQDEALRTALNGTWQGGIDLQALQAAELRAYGWFQYLVSVAKDNLQSNLFISKEQVGTNHGLAKVPYLRDTRRSRYGLYDFRLSYADLKDNSSSDGTAKHFEDTVAIGSYHYADIHKLDKNEYCMANYPSYVSQSHPINPYYIPFRALTVRDVSNVLVCGKTMSQTFLANAGTRLHPTEWSSGVAAGAAAAMMVVNDMEATKQVYENVKELQQLLSSDLINSPLTWTLSSQTSSNALSTAPKSTSTYLQATWLPVSYNCSSKESVLNTFLNLKSKGVQRVYVDVWNQGVVYFQSPTMMATIGEKGLAQGDLLSWALEAGNSTNIEVFAWFEYGLMTSYQSINNAFAQYAQDHDWIIGLHSNFYWIDADNSEVIDFLSGIMGDAIQLYGPKGLKGVQLDDHFAMPVDLGGNVGIMNKAMDRLSTNLRGLPEMNDFGVQLSLSPAPMDLSLPTYAVDWSYWGDQHYYDEAIPQLYRSDFSSFKAVFDATKKALSIEANKLWQSSGLRIDGSGANTPEADVMNMITYSSQQGKGSVMWYARGILETYPSAFSGSKAWGV